MCFVLEMNKLFEIKNDKEPIFFIHLQKKNKCKKVYV